MRRLVSIVTLFLLSSILFTPSISAESIESTLEANNNYWAEQMSQGVIPLSMQGDDPISTKTLKSSKNEYQVIDTFADGSVRSTSISGGKCISGSGYSECSNRLIKSSSAGIVMQFRADYGTYNGAPSKIHRAYDYSYRCTLLSCSFESFDNNASTETSNYGATATLTINVKNFSSYSQSLQLYIKGYNISVRYF